MRVPIFLIAFLFTALLAVKRKKSTEAQENANEAFLERERMANATRKKDISALPYLSFSTDTLPVGELRTMNFIPVRLFYKTLRIKRSSICPCIQIRT